MTFRPHPKYAKNQARFGPWSTCDTCGLLWSLSDLKFQYDYRGGSAPEKTGFIKCPRCLNMLRYQAKLLVLPPDPPSFANVRPEQYNVDETNFLTTFTTPTGIQSASFYVTTGGDNYISSVPNPSSGPVTYLGATMPGNLIEEMITEVTLDVMISEGSQQAMVEEHGEIAILPALFLDLYNGDPSSTGNSVLKKVTGSSTRTNIAASMVLSSSQAFNPLDLPITTSAVSATNVNFVGFFDAATDGNLLASGPCSVVAPSVVPSVYLGYGVSFATGQLVINL